MLSVSNGCGEFVGSCCALRNRDARDSYKIYYGSVVNWEAIRAPQDV
jgi:hypothetical protein